MGLPALVVLLLAALAGGSITVASLALAHLFWGWGVFFFYTLPAVFFVVWTVRELAPSAWRRVEAPWRWAWRRTAIGSPQPSRRPPRPPAEPLAGDRKDRSPPRPGGRAVGSLRSVLRGVSRPWLITMRWFLDAWRSPGARRLLAAGFALSAGGGFALVGYELERRGWPLDQVQATPTAGAGALFLVTFAFKALGWQRLFRAYERPRSLALATATGAAALMGLALPGRFDDAVRVAILRRMPGRRPGVGTLVLSLLLLGMIDAAALAPLAAAAAAASDTATFVRIAFAVVAAAGLGAGITLAALPRISASERLGRYGLTHWLSRHAPASPRDALWAFLLVLLAWLTRAAAVFVLFGALGFAGSFALAVAYVAAGAASGALPIGPAGAATQAGVGAAVLATAGLSPTDAVAFALAAQGLTVLAGAAVVLLAIAVHGSRRAFAARPAEA